MKIKAILFDIGGTILNADDAASALMEMQKNILRENGFMFSDEEFDEVVRQIMLTFVPGLQRAVVWHFTKPDVARCNDIVGSAREFIPEIVNRHPSKLYPGVGMVLNLLCRCYTLALAGNASTDIKKELARFGVLRFFKHTRVSGDIGISKPDTRFFEHVLREIGVPAETAVMIGDRLDNDIIPAKMLGMRSILVKQGEYAILEPRTPKEIPNATVTEITQVPEAIERIAEA